MQGSRNQVVVTARATCNGKTNRGVADVLNMGCQVESWNRLWRIAHWEITYLLLAYQQTEVMESAFSNINEQIIRLPPNAVPDRNKLHTMLMLL